MLLVKPLTQLQKLQLQLPKMLLRLASHQHAYEVITECAHFPPTFGARSQRCQPDWLVLSAHPEILLSSQSTQPPRWCGQPLEMPSEWYAAWSLQTPPKPAYPTSLPEEPQAAAHHDFPR